MKPFSFWTYRTGFLRLGGPATVALMTLLPGFPLPAAASDEPRQDPGDSAEQDTVEPEEEEASTLRPEVSFPGQYRINAYSVDNDLAAEDQQTASRLRIRQGIDVHFDERFKTHLVLQLNHTSGNQGLSQESVRVRHAVLDYTSPGGAQIQAGIVPLSDRFGDALFSSDWDYNPVAVAVTVPAGLGTFRLFAGNLDEGVESEPKDDIVHYQVEYDLPLRNESRLVFAGTWLEAPDAMGESRSYSSLGMSSAWRLSSRFSLRSFLVASAADEELLGIDSRAEGLAGKVELVGSLPWGEVGVLATWAAGDSRGGGFLPPMSLIGFNGYWGYTGILTVQGPTDTGFDGDAVNVSNNGYGLISVQGRWSRALTEGFDLQLAAGWFGGSQAEGRSDRVGVDLLALGTYRLNKVLGLDIGIAAARLEDSVSGYFEGAAGGFRQPVGVSRDKVALFSRLQAEF